MTDTCIAFHDHTCVMAGPTRDVAAVVKRLTDSDPTVTVLVFDATTSEPVELDLRGTVDDVLARLAGPVESQAPETRAVSPAVDPGSRAPGRPRLGVVAREVTLLPRHWEWLNEQPGGASVTLRKLVEEARKATAGEARIRRPREACYRFMNHMAGNEPGYEEALRALYAGDAGRFNALTEDWPVDVRDHTRRLAEAGWPGVSPEA